MTVNDLLNTLLEGVRDVDPYDVPENGSGGWVAGTRRS